MGRPASANCKEYKKSCTEFYRVFHGEAESISSNNLLGDSVIPIPKLIKNIWGSQGKRVS